MKKNVTVLVLATVVASAGLFVPWSNEAVNLPATQQPVAGLGEGISLGEDLDQIAIETKRQSDQESPTESPKRTLTAGTAVGGGQLLVRTRWVDDLSPAGGIGIEIRPHDGRHPRLHTQRKVTGADGLVRFAGLAEGILGIYMDRREGEVSVLDAFGNIQGGNVQPGVTLSFRAGSLEPRPSFVGYQQQTATSFASQARSELLLELWKRMVEASLTAKTATRHAKLAKNLDSLLDPMQLDLSSRLPSRLPIRIETIGSEPVYVEILVARGIDLSGRVVDASGHGVESAEIWLFGKGMAEGQVLTHSDAQGIFHLADLEQGSEVIARAAGFEPSPPCKLRGMAGQQQETELILDQRAGILRGQVVDEFGVPLADATLRLGNPAAKPAPVYQHSESEGRFLAIGLPRGNLRVLVLAPGFQPHQEIVFIQPEVITERRLQLQPGWILSGRVLDSKGGGQEGRTIYADAKGEPTTEVTSGTDGRFSLETLPPGPLTLRIEDGHHRPLRERVQGSAGERMERDLHLLGWTRIEGHLQSDRGKPMLGWWVRAVPLEPEAGPRSNLVGKDGDFALTTDPELAYRIEVFQRRVPSQRASYREAARSGSLILAVSGPRATDEGLSALQVIRCDWLGEIEGNRKDLMLRIPDSLMPSATLRGQVLDADGQPLVGNAEIFVDDKQRRVDTDRAGRFSIGPLIPGSYRFEMICEDESIPPFEIGPTSLAANQDLDLGILEPPAGGLLAVELVDARAVKPQGLWQLRILDGSDRLARSLWLTKDAARTAGLIAGAYRAELLEAGKLVKTESFQIRSGATTSLRLELDD